MGTHRRTNFTANMTRKTFGQREERTANIVLAIGGLNGFVSTEVQYSTSILRLSDSAKNPAHRQYVNRYQQDASKNIL